MHRSVDLASIRARLKGREPRRLSGRQVLARAAVAAVLREEPGKGPEVLLMRRAEHPDDPWSGHMAFPGGRQDPEDRDLLQTAWRETLEEVGLDLHQQAEWLGRLDDLPAVARGRSTGMVITPFVFQVLQRPTLLPNYEVSELLWAPLPPLLCGQADTTRAYEYEGHRYELPAFEVQGRIVWGLTYQMLQSLFALVRRD
jgi:8-oxo-dGTP pyrophosphatase MutT (NUDIX family)